MSWVRLDDHFPTHPKMVAAGGDAGWLHVCALCYCAEHLTDGILPKAMVPRLSDRKEATKLAARLVEAGVWYDEGDDYRLHDFLEYNRSRDEVQLERRAARDRRELNADGRLPRQIKARDQDCCRYCGRHVSWSDRRGEGGATYDHVIPRGPNTLENVVVACRGCNMRKGPRTPDAAGMVLLPAPHPNGSKNRPRTDLEPARNVSGPDPTRPELPTEAVRPRKRGTQLPDDWQPSEATKNWMRTEYPAYAKRGVVEAFKDYCVSRGKAFIDFDRALKNWVRNEAKFHPTPEARGPARTYL